MGTLPAIILLILTTAYETQSNGSGEFKRMPELRGQSFGLENFLMQPFNLASAVEGSPPPRAPKRTHHTDSYSVEYEVQNDEFDMRRLVPTLPGASMVFNQAEPHRDHKPVHEEIEESPPPRRRQHDRPLKRKPNIEEETQNHVPRKRIPEHQRHVEKMPSLEEEIQSLVSITPFQENHRERLPSLEEEIQSLVPRKRLPETRRPLERPAEFMLSIQEHAEPFPSPIEEARPHRKRVMKRRRKKPSPALPETNQDEKLIAEIPIKEIDDNLYGTMPTSYQETVKDTTGAESIVIEHGTRRKHGQRTKEPIYTESEGLSRYEDKLLSEATQTVPQRDIIQSIPEARPELLTPTTDNPESTQRLKTLLKQQNGQLSLSELLQTQNLSLSDFLKGNPGALSALGGTKVNKPTENPFVPEAEKTKPRPNIPKISSKSRPFSKPFNGTKPTLRRSTTSTTTEAPTDDLPKRLQIIEVTSDKPTYNGFAPKRPRIRIGPKDKFNFSRERTEEPTTEKPTTEKLEEKEEQDDEENELQTTRSPPRLLRTSTSTEEPIQEISSTEGRKRYGEYRPKIKIDRRKPFGDGTTEETGVTEAKETTVISTTEEIKTKESRNRVRIPFMSVNNPEISVILPSKKPNTTTEKPRPSPVIKDRINVFKRLNSEEKVANENTVDSHERGTEPPEGIFPTKPLSTTTVTPVTDKTTTEDEMTGNETSDEIVELLRTGSNALRLQRILEARNMTVNELVEKRANSSKHPNVTKLFEKTEPKLHGRNKVTELNDNHYPSTERSRAVHTTKRIMPVFDILSPNYKTENSEKIRIKSEVVKPPETNSFDELFVDESVVRPIKLPIDEAREPKSYEKDVKQNRLHLSPGVEGKPKTPIPLWNVEDKPIYGSYPTYEMNKNLAGRVPEPTKIIEEELLISETINTQDPNSRLQSSINDILKEQVDVKDVKEDIAIIPPAVKSAIIASGVVMGIALVVFVAIFAACGWRQRQFRLRARSSILNDSIDGSARKAIRRTGTLSPVSFKRSALYKKSIDFDTESSVSGSSNTSSYLWNTLKHTFQSRNSTLKNREEKEDKIQERENRSRRNTLCRDDERPRRETLTRDGSRRDADMPRRNTLTREDLRRDSLMSRDTLSRETPRDSLGRDIQRDSLARDPPRESLASRDLIRTESRRSSCFRDERRLNNLMRDNERCSFRAIDPDRQIIQTSVNFKRGGFNGSRHFDTCDHFN